MTVTDPIADMLTRIRNAIIARHDQVPMPASRMKISIAKVLKEEGFIADYEVVKGDTPQRVLKIYLKYSGKKQSIITGLRRVSKPGIRVYSPRDRIPRIYAGLGVAIMSTPEGVMAGSRAWKKNVGGEILCYVW